MESKGLVIASSMNVAPLSRREIALLWTLAWMLRVVIVGMIAWATYAAIWIGDGKRITEIGAGLLGLAGTEFYVWAVRKRIESHRK
jgi:hypothetical protein